MRQWVLGILLIVLLIACRPKVPAAPQQAPIPVPEPVVPQQAPAAQGPIAPQQAPVPAEPAPPQQAAVPPARQRLTTTITPARDLTGQWTGSFTFTNNCPNPACRYQGRLVPPSLALNLVQNGNQVAGAITVDFNQFAVEELVGMPCPTFREAGGVQQTQLVGGTVSSSRFTFQDVGGNTWDLMLITDLLKGTVSNNNPGCMGIQSSDVSLSRVT